MKLSPRALVALLVAGLAGCYLHVAGLERVPGTSPRCERDVCVEVVSFWVGDEIFGLWTDAPPGTLLRNARFAAHEEAPCAGPFSAAWVVVDESLFRTGPADVGGSHGLTLGFPNPTWYGHFWSATYLDLELEVAGVPRCVRTRLTDAAGHEAVGR
jgi:hypothetical protein